MSLATRCSTCGTTFRVVQDQLKVSEGWVRCGRCETVFNAVEGLFDLERDAPELPHARMPPTPAVPAPTTTTVAAPLAPRKTPPASTAVASPGGLPVLPPVPPPAEPESADDPDSDPPHRLEKPGPKPAVGVGARDRLEFSDARFDSDLFEEDPRLGEEAGESPVTNAGALSLESERAPEFLRRVDRRPGWRPEASRGLLTGALALAAFGLALQVAVHHRDAIASAWPWTHGPLDAACAVAGCTVEAPRRIDALSVESTALARAVGQDGFLLTVALRNRSAATLVTPSVDLTLTDGGGRLVARRALAPVQLRAAPTIGAGADVQLQAAVDVRGVRVAGYTVEIFYP